MTLQDWGINTTTAPWDMRRPAASAFPSTVLPNPYLVVPKYPSYSVLLFRQTARKTPLSDSGEVFRGASPNEGRYPTQWKSWMFKAKWGSKAWRDSAAAHSVALNQVFTSNLFENDGSQMPPLATYIPDTAALKILGEWVTNYYTLTVVPGEDPVLSIHGAHLALEGSPSIQNRQLIVPGSWTGKAVMISLDGRSTPLSSVGRGRYVLPASMPVGVYFFKVGNHSFRTSVMK
jgi:hypothetical protein